MKTKYYDSVNITYRNRGEKLWFITVKEGILGEGIFLASFYLPRYPEQSMEAIRYRLKRDFNIEFGNNSVTHKL